MITEGLALAADGDPAKGGQFSSTCMACHRIGEGAKNLIGPVLNNVIGRQGRYGRGIQLLGAWGKSSGENGLVWNEDLINQYLPDPNAFLKKFLTDKGKPRARRRLDQDDVPPCERAAARRRDRLRQARSPNRNSQEFQRQRRQRRLKVGKVCHEPAAARTIAAVQTHHACMSAGARCEQQGTRPHA